MSFFFFCFVFNSLYALLFALLYPSIASPTSRSSRPEVFCKKGALRNFAKFLGKHLCQSLMPATLIKKRLWHRCFPVNFAKFLRTPFLTEHLQWLLLNKDNQFKVHVHIYKSINVRWRKLHSPLIRTG